MLFPRRKSWIALAEFRHRTAKRETLAERGTIERPVSDSRAVDPYGTVQSAAVHRQHLQLAFAKIESSQHAPINARWRLDATRTKLAVDQHTVSHPESTHDGTENGKETPFRH